jgi:two-component system, NarL family, nitrate/nitrite response regulator NarL
MNGVADTFAGTMLPADLGAETCDRVNILIVEDNRHMRRLLREMVSAEFAPDSVAEAANGRSALALCQEIRPELILMDVGLPDVSGIELTAAIKSTLLPGAKVVIVSNHRSALSQDAARKAGASAYVFKDEVADQLLSTLRAVLG